MRKITLISCFALFSSLAFSQTPCSPVSPLDCSEVDVNLPVNLNFNGTDGGILNTGFTMVDPPSARLASDDAGADPDIPGLLTANLAVSGGWLDVTATNGINFSQLSGSPSSTLTNSQMNALGVGFGAGPNVIDVSATIAQPNFATTANSGLNGSQQAGIWFGLDENNFVKLVVVKASATQQKIQMALEQTDPGNSANLIITEFNTANFNISGITDITFRISIDPTDNSIRGFYALDNGSEVQVTGGTDFLAAPDTFFDGVDHDSNIATDTLAYAGIMTSTRRSTGGSMVISYDSFYVQEVIAPFQAHVNFQDEATVPPSGYSADFGLGFPAVPVQGDYGWKKADNLTSIDVNGTESAGRNRITGTYDTASLQNKLEGTLVHFQGDNIASWAGQNRGNELIWEMKVPNGTYDVTVGLGDKSSSTDSRHSATIEGYTIIPAFVPASGQVKTETMTVSVSDGFLTLNGVGGFNSKVTHIDILESTGSPVNGSLAFDPAAVSPSLAAGSTGTFSSNLSSAGAAGVALTIDDNIDETGFNDWMNLPPADLGQVDFNMDATSLAIGDTKNSSIIATAKGSTPAILTANFTVTAPASTETEISTFALAEETAEAIIGPGTIDIEVATGTDLNGLAPAITLSAGATVTPASGDTVDFSAGTVTYTVTAEDDTTTQDWAVTVTESVLANSAPTITSAATASVAENQTSAIDVDTSDDNDSEGSGLQYSLTGANDDALFEVDVVTGLVTFKTAPDFESPNDADGDNSFDIQVTVIDSGALSALQDITITVTDVPEADTALVINEIMINPAAVTDTAGEWFELYNPGTEDVNINGWIIKDNNADSHEITSDGGQLLIPASGYLVLGNNLEVGTNGGKIVDYQYSGFILANTGDEVVLVDDADNEIDRVDYDGATFPNPQGASIALNAPTEDNAIGSNWSAATAVFGIGDLGTPGIANVGKANESPVISSLDALEVEENQTAVLDLEVADDLDSEGSGITYSLSGGVDDTLFAIEADTGDLTFLVEPDFETPTDVGADNIYDIQVTVTDSGTLTATQDIAITVTDIDEITPFLAFINFQNNPSSTVPPTGYLPDYGKDFGNAAVTVNGTDYDFGWKLLSDNSPWDASDEAPSNSSGVGRMRLADIGTYNGADIPTKLTGTLVHFQGDNIAGWGDGEPRKNELYWELVVPNGVYAVTLGLGDKASNNVDSRHTATLEGYTIIPAFRPADTETRVATIIVEVTDGALTMNGLGGFNSKITHIEVVESTGTPVNGILAFGPNTASETLEAGVIGSFTSTLSGVGATDITLNIEDDPINVEAGNSNDWLSLPATDVPGEFVFTIDASTLSAADTRNNRIIATATGFTPAILDADLTVTEAPIVFLSAPFRMNVAGTEYTRDADVYQAEDLSFLVETQVTTVSSTAYSPYTVPGGHTDLYYPRRYGPEFSYNFPIANGNYTVAVHMVENFQTAANARIFDVSFEGDVLIDGLDLFATYGKGGLAILSFDVEVIDEELNIDFLASVNNGIVQAIEILPVAQSNATDILTFVLDGVQTGAASIDTDLGAIAIEVANGTDLTALSPTITLSDGATILPASGEAQDFSTGAVPYTVTAEDGTIEVYNVTVTEALPPVNTPPVITANQVFSIGEASGLDAVVGTVEAIDDDDALTYSITDGNTDGIFSIGESTGEITISQLVDYAAAQQYTLTVEVSDGANAVSDQITIDVLDTICNPLSSLPCDQVAVQTLPLNLDFTVANGNLSQSGLTTVLAPSARLAGDDASITDARIPGYAPDLIAQDANGLTITSTKGIFFSQLQNIGRIPSSANTNSQLNAMGVGLSAPASTFSVSTTLVVPDFSASAGNSSQQAGIWYGLDEDRYVKLVLSKTGATSQRVQLQVEDLTNNPGSIVEVNMDGFSFTVGEALKLRLEFDPIANTVQGYYTLGTGTEVLVTNGSADFIAVPEFYFDGTSYDTANPTALLNFAGIFTTHRNAAADQSLDFLFKDFAIEEVTAPLSDQAEILTFAINGIDGTIASTGTDTGIVALEVLNDADLAVLMPIITVSDLAAIAPASGDEVDFTNPVDYVVTAENGATKTWTVTVTKEDPQTDTFAFIENFDSYTPSTGDLDAISNGDWVKQTGDENLEGIPVLNEGLTPGTSFSLEINNTNAIAVHDFQKLIDAPVSLQANVPFYYGTYFNIAELGGSEGNRIRVAIRVDDDGGEATAWVRHIIGRYGGNINARLGLGGSNSNSGETTIGPDQLFQFVVKGVWDGVDSISYEYTIAPTLTEGDNVWIPASDTQAINGTPKLGRIFISSTSTANNGKIGPIRLSTDYAQVVTEDIIETPSPCSPFSTLPCDQIVTSTSVDLNFDGTGEGLSNTGFTMVDPYSGTRVAEDGAPSNTDVPGYEPGNLSVSSGNLVITANKGIAYLDNNAQINTVGLGLQNINSPITIETKLLGITTGGNSAQAGLWFGIDDDNFVKLDVNNNNIELRVERAGASANNTTDQLQVNATASTQDVVLEMVVDPTALSVEAFYTVGTGSRTSLGSLLIPSNYVTGKEINPEVGNASFAGVYATYRNGTPPGAIFDATFDYFRVSEEASLSFDVAELNFSGETGEVIPSQTVTLSASSGTPTVILSDDPDAASWLILPTDPVIGALAFGIVENLPPGNYSTTIFAIDQPDLGYTNGELQINLEITEPINDFAVNINFSDPATPAPENYEKDAGDTYGDRGNGFAYGWLDANTSAPANLTLNGRNREVAGVSVLNNTLSHMQYGDVSTNAANGYLPDAKWEIEVPNGTYLVTVFVGDPNVDNPAANIPAHRINAEGINVVDNYIPTGVVGASTRFTSQSATIAVSDGRLTLDPLGTGGKNTKINSVQIVATTGGVQTPRVAGVTPVDGATGVPVNTSISANDLVLPNVDDLGNAGVDNSTITNNTVKLIKVQNGNQVLASVNGTGGGDAINLVPTAPLEANTEYRFEIDGVLDLVGEPFEVFASTFTTGSGNTGPITDLDNVSFANAGAVASGSKYSTLTIGPDGKLYGLQINGDIDRWSIESDGTLSGLEQLDAWKANYNNNRTSVGLTFDPDATAQNLIAYISHNSGGLSGAPAWDGNISRLTGANLETEALIVTNLPRSKKDHLTNSISFKPGEPNVLYFNQGSNSAAGAPDNAWGNRKERLLSAAALRLNLDLLPEGNWPLNAKTTMDPAAINNVDVNSSTLVSTVGTYTEDGETFTDNGTYNPFYVNAPLTLFGTGIRNAYDLVWHSNGQLYIPTNGTAGGSNAPASIDDTRRPNGSFYDHDAVSGNYPIIPASNNNNVQKDWLFRLNPANPLGYYGHPNPLRGEFVLNRGDADVNNTVYNGVVADINYRGDAFDFENNKSPNGVIEYSSNAENGNLTGALLVVRYSGGSDIIALVPDGPNGDIATFKEGIPGFTGFGDPLDLVEDVTNGNIYVSDYGRSEIVLLRPNAQAAPEALIVLDTEEVVGDAVTSSDYNQEILLSNLGNATLTGISAQITGTDSGQFQVSGLPLTLNAQNSDAFNIIFTPTSIGPKTAQLTISGTGVEDVIIPLNGLGKLGLGGSNEPSLQWILDTRLGSGAVDVGDENAATNVFDVSGLTVGSDAYKAALSGMLGDELDIQSFERAVDAPVTLELLSVYGPTGSNPVVAFGWYDTGNASALNELITVTNDPTSNGQRLNPPLTGLGQFDPGTQSFGFYSEWPFFGNRKLFSEDALNTFPDAIPHHVRVYAMPDETDAYIIATEEHISGFDYQDIVVIARNIKPAGEDQLVACSPISTLDCEEITVTLPYSLDFDGTEGGLSNTGFTMVDNPSVRLDLDLPISNPDVLGYEPGKISLGNGNLVLEANNGIAFRTEGAGNTQSTDVNSQVNTLGVGFDADTYGNFSITTTIVNPYTDGSNNSEQAGLWFGLNEDNFVKLIANGNGQLELRSELNGLSENVDQVIATVENLNTSTVQLRLFVDMDNNALVASYTLNSGLEVELGGLPLPSEYLAGNASYDNQSFAGIFATKRRETSANVVYTFEDFAIAPENPVALVATRINAGGTATYTDAQSNLWELDETFLTGNSEVSFKTFDVAGTAEDPLFLEYRFSNDDAGQPGTPFGYAIPVTGTGPYTVKLYFIEPFFGIPGGGQGGTGSRVFNVAIEDGQASLTNYDLNAQATPGTLITETFSDIAVTDGNLTIDFTAVTNNAIISAIEVIGSESIAQPFFANVNPADNATDVAINDFQITVDVVVPVGYELDKATLVGNVNLYEIVNGNEVLVPSNSNDTGGGDAITLTPLSPPKAFTNYRFKLTSGIEANRFGDLNDRLPFVAFESDLTTGDEETVTPLDLTGVEFTKIEGGTVLGDGTLDQRFSSLAVGPDGKLYGSTIGDFASDGKIYRWDMAADGTLENLQILSPVLQGAPHPVNGARNNNDRLIIGFAFDPAATADNLIAYITHSFASESSGPEWDGVLSRLSGPDLSVVEDLIIHLPRSSKDHLTNSITFDPQGQMYINQGSNSAGGQPDGSWAFRPERLLTAAVLKLELNKLPSNLPFSAYTTDDIGVINAASSTSLTMSDGTYNPYATNASLTLFSTGVRNAYDLVWHSNGWLYVPTNGTAGGSNTPATASYPLARRIDGLTTIPSAPATNSNETQKDWLFKTKGGSYHGHPNPYRGEFILNHGGAPYSGVPGQQEASHTDVAKYPDNLGPDPNYREPAYDFEFNKSPNGVIEYKSDAFGGKLQGLLMVVRFSGQDDLLVMQPEANGNIGNVNGDVPGMGGFDDPLDVVEDPETGNIYVSEYDRSGNGTPRLTLLRATVPATTGPKIVAAPNELIFETTVNNEGNNTDTKTVEVTNDGNEVLNISSASITGSFGDQFETVQPAGAITINPGESQIYTVTYAPDLDNTDLGYQEASLTITSDATENLTFSVGLHALKKRGFEGGEEPALQDVVDALGIGIDVGWTSLANGVDPNPVGDESEVELWIKANDAPINVTPVGRYSPGETLPFGWYTNDNGIVATNEVGILADGIENAQTLFPPIGSGEASFDPQGSVFGFYVESNTFNRLSYTQDAVNATQTGGVTHRTRIYPMADRNGNPIENSYLIAFEDASNGDYQDYMFIIDNVIPFESGLLALEFNKGEVDFIASINQEDIPVQQVILSRNGGITAAGIELEASEAWVVVPENFELGTSFDIGVDVSSLSIGSYQATITAKAPNYEDAVVNVSLEVTNELVYTYQFNFQDPDDLEISPAGYIDDIGMPYSVQSTANLGDLTFGWVLPATLTPADAGVNGRNRNTGTNDDALSKTFTIIGHRTAADFPTRDWVVNLPNGTYSVNMSVGGDPQFSDSNHVLDVNGVTVVDYDQQSIVPETFENFENTKFVDVTNGTLRLALAAGGENAKVNYIRLAPIDASLLPPTIIATFDGNESGPDIYRGTVNITLEATDNSESGGIASLEYALDGNTAVSYDQPISVGGEGPHSLVVTAEDNNGNLIEKTYDFSIEAPTGALLAIENMTKVPGTDRGFPADDYYTFHRLGNPGEGLVHDANVMRLNNTGTGDLIVTDAIVSDTNDYTVEVLDNTGALVALPVTIAPGSFADLDITFIGTTGNGNNGIFVENIEIVSNADNALENTAVLHGAYSPQPEGGDEINAQEVFDAFGFQSSMLSIVNDQGNITPPNDIRFRPSSNYPDPANIDAGYEGDMILSSTFVQADPNKPVIGIQISALHGGPGSNGARFVAVNGTGTVGGINFSHDARYYQTLLPKTGANINFDTANSINGPFRIAVSNYLSSGGNDINGNRPDLLGLRIYKVIDHKGNVVPNEYIVLQDFVQGGCGAGSANCDWNDNTFYFINIRPEGVPTAQPTEAYLANVGENLDLDIAQYFDKGYPGNSLTITASVANGGLPTWLTYNTVDGTLSGTPPADTTGSIEVDFDAVDPNGLTASTTLIININEPPVAVDDEVTTTQNVAILLDQLLTNDSEPNAQDILITTVDTPQNGTAELQVDGLSILYTPETDYVGSDSFTYTIEDESGLTASANVSITVTPENQAPTALIVTNVDGGPAALFVEFTGSGSTDENPATLQYEWNFGDGVGSASDADTSYTFTSAGVFTVSLTVTDDQSLFDVATTVITVSAPPNTGPTAVASATPNNSNPLQFGFDGSASTDTEGAVSYQWNFGDGNSSSEVSPSHTYALAGTYDVSLTVTDEGDLTDAVTLQVVAEEPVTNDFALRINAGGPQVVHNGETFSADQNFVGGKVYVNTSAQVPALYQTERSASPPTFGYNIPLDNGRYQVSLHFAEIYHGATGGGTGGNGKRVFDVTLEGDIVLNDYDINADVGTQTIVTKIFEITVEDGILNMIFDAAGSDGVDQPKLSAITVLGIDDPIVECELPEEWANSDIGAVAADGETCYDNGRYEVSASGVDIWGSADEFHYVYQQLEGDGEIIAQVVSLDPTNIWAKAGVMMRNDLDANSASAMMIIAPDPQSLGGPGHSFQHRPSKGAVMGGANFTTPALVPGGFPHYVRMVRSGNTFTGYISETNGNWTSVGSVNIPMNESIFVGLATTSHNDGTLTNAVYENVEVIDTAISNAAPSAVAEATPLSGEAPLQVSFTGSNSTDDGNLGELSYEWTFGNGDTSTDTDPVYTFDTPGTYTVTLIVSDAQGLESEPSSVTIEVEPVTVSDFALRINAGGPALVHNGETFVADQNFVGGKSYTNVNATLPVLYQTERSALPPNFGYEIPLENGTYKVTLHFAELFWGANGGKPGGVGTRIFDVVMEGNTVLNDYDIIADVGSQTAVTKTFDVVIQDGTLSLALDAAGSDGKNEPKLSAIEIVSVGTTNAAPTAVANADTDRGEAPLQVSFNSNGSDDDKAIVSYLWDFKDGTTSTDEDPQHIFETPDVYTVSLTVSDAEGETDEAIVTITVDEPVINDFALRINAGGPQVVHNGNTFSADTNFVGGKVYENNSATVPSLYKTERSALPPNFAYNVSVDNGNYQVVLHFAEIYWGATGGGTGGIGKRVFDVALEGNTILNDYDINADIGPQTVVVKTFNVAVTDGVLNLAFDAAGSDGVDQPKVSAIEILGVGSRKLDPVVDAGADFEVTLPTNVFIVTGSGSDPDGGSVTYQWTQVNGPDTALLGNDDTLEMTAEVLVEGSYTFRLTVTDDENVSAFDEVTVTAVNPNLEEVWLEAECAIVGSGWTTVNDGSQSGGQYLSPPSNFQSSPSNNASSIVSFDFLVTAGTYKIFGLVKTPSGTQDSFWVRVNGGAWVRWNSIPPSNNFAWHRIHLNEQLSQPRSFEFVEGVNRIDIGHREGGVGLDKLYVTQTDDIPTGLGGASTNCGEVNPSFDSNVIAGNSGNANKTVPVAYNDPIPNEVSMYPNAAVSSTQITMSNPEADITKLYVYDVSGRLIRSYEGLELETSPGAYVLQVSNLNNGIYLLRMMATDGNIFDEKLVVRH